MKPLSRKLTNIPIKYMENGNPFKRNVKRRPTLSAISSALEIHSLCWPLILEIASLPVQLQVKVQLRPEQVSESLKKVNEAEAVRLSNSELFCLKTVTYADNGCRKLKEKVTKFVRNCRSHKI